MIEAGCLPLTLFHSLPSGTPSVPVYVLNHRHFPVYDISAFFHRSWLLSPPFKCPTQLIYIAYSANSRLRILGVRSHIWGGGEFDAFFNFFVQFWVIFWGGFEILGRKSPREIAGIKTASQCYFQLSPAGFSSITDLDFPQEIAGINTALAVLFPAISCVDFLV